MALESVVISLICKNKSCGISRELFAKSETSLQVRELVGECGKSSNAASNDESMDIMSTFISVDCLKIHHMSENDKNSINESQINTFCNVT